MFTLKNGFLKILLIVACVTSGAAFADEQCRIAATQEYKSARDFCQNDQSCLRTAYDSYNRAMYACQRADNGGGGGSSQVCVGGHTCTNYDSSSGVCHLWEDYTVCGYGCQTRHVCRDYDAYRQVCKLWETEASCR